MFTLSLPLEPVTRYTSYVYIVIFYGFQILSYNFRISQDDHIVSPELSYQLCLEYMT